MSSAIKPVLTTQGSPQNQTVVSAQINKPMHPQGAQTTYGQPSAHIPQNLVNIPPANAHSGNYYSINVPNAPQHYMGGNAPASNHPVAVSSQPPTGQQMYSPSKSTTYTGGYQSNLSHSPSVLPPVTQTLPPTQQQQPPQTTASTPTAAPTPQQPPSEPPADTSKPQANGTPEKTTATPPKPTTNTEPPPPPQQQQNHVVVNKEKPTPVPVVEKSPEKGVVEVKEVKTTTAEVQQKSVSTNSASVASAPVQEQNKVVVGGGGGGAQVAAAAQPVNAQAKIVKEQTTLQPPQQPQPQQPTQPQQQQQQQAPQQKASSTLKLATTPRGAPNRKPKPTPSPTTSSNKTETTPTTESTAKTKPETATPKPQKSSPATPSSSSAVGSSKSKRTRIQTQPYQSPLPELEIISKMTSNISTPRNRSDEKLIVFFKNEFLAVRNSEGGFYVCQAVQNIYKSSQKIKIRWLSQDKNDKNGEIYTPDFYDHTDFDCILTNLNLSRVEKGKFKLPSAERIRTDSILKRALAVEKGDAVPPSPTEEHPDGLDLSLYKEESQLKKRKGKKRKATSPLKIDSKSKSTKKSPTASKVRKVATAAGAAAKVTKPKTKAKLVGRAVARKQQQQGAVVSEKKKAAVAQGRAERAAKRRGPDGGSAAAATRSPVVDQKKAKVLAKVARKSGQKKQAPAKNTKAPRVATAATTKVQKASTSSKNQQTVTRKTKRSTRK